MRSIAQLCLLGVTAVTPKPHEYPDVCKTLDAPTSGGRKRLMSLWCEYSEAPVLDRFLETANAYERHLPAPGSQAQIKILEMGVQSGGSTRTWRKHYGSSLYYVGLDINPGCIRSAREAEQTFVEIGSQVNNR